MALTPADRILAESLIGSTPVQPLAAIVNGARHRILLKLEAFNGGGGSIKARTALGLLDRAAGRGLLPAGATVIESTSGNLGAALAIQGEMRGLRVTIVADPKTTAANLGKIGLAGATVEMVKEPDASGSFLEARLERVRALLREREGSVWLNQYESAANPEIHFFSTGREIVADAPAADAIFIACSTGGTFSGVSARVRASGIPARVFPVDVPGSHALASGRGRRILTGIGASHPSVFVAEEDRPRLQVVDDLEAIAACQAVRAETGLSIGGSSGAAFVAALRWLSNRPPGQTVLVLCADGGDGYDFSSQTLATQGVDHLPSLRGLLDDLALENELRPERLPSNL